MRKRIYYRMADVRIIKGRGRGFSAWLEFQKKARAAGNIIRSHLCTCNVDNLIDANTQIRIA